MVFHKNRSIFALVAVLMLLLVGAVYFYNKTLNDLAAGSCSDVNGPECPHAKLVETQNAVIAALLLAILAIVGYIVYQSHWKKQDIVEEKAESSMEVSKPAHQERKKIDVSSLDSDEKKVIAIIQEQDGSTFQSEIIKQTNYSKVKISRVLDKLEQKGMIERKRRGMTNLVVIR
jgi:uncharacterized membrane protein